MLELETDDFCAYSSIEFRDGHFTFYLSYLADDSEVQVTQRQEFTLQDFMLALFEKEPEDDSQTG